MKIIDIGSAIRVLRPNAKFIIHGNTYEGIEDWDDGGENPPTEAEIDAEIKKQEKEYSDNKYQRDRIYPFIGEQLDLLYHDMTSGKVDGKTGEWYKAVKKVKDDNPKS